MGKYLNKITLTIAIVILFIPTIIAFIYINSVDNEPAVPDNSTVYVSISNGTTSTNIDDEKLVKRITDDISNASAVIDTTGLPLYDGESYVMTVRAVYSKTRETKKEYTCYLNIDPTQCYFKNENGTVFPFSDETAVGLLKLDVCQKVLTYVENPTAKAGDTELEPVSVKWNYINTLGDTVSDDKVKPAAKIVNVNYAPGDKLSDKLSLGTIVDKTGQTRAPEQVFVTFVNGEEEYPRTVISEADALISTKNFKSDTVLSMKVEVIWGTDDLKLGYYGTVEYSLTLRYDLPATFEISNSAVYAGALPLMRARNLNPDEDITVSVTSELGNEYKYKPTFMPYENVHIAFLPFDCTDKGGVYKVHITCGENEFELKTDVKTKVYETRSATVPAKILTECYGDSKKLSFELTMEDVYANIVKEKLWIGGFVYPISNATKAYSYGQNIKINSEYTDRALCNIYYTSNAENAVKAANNGVVVYTGTTPITGKLVVIEHGYGYKSWYWNMDSYDVKVGDTVKKGQQIGKVGKTGLCTETSYQLSYAVSIGNVFINPDMYMGKLMDYFDKNK